MRVRRWAALAAASAVLVGASGCGGDGTATDDPADSVAEAPSEAEPSEEETSEEPEEVSGGYDRDELLAAMRAAVAGQQSAHMVMEFSGGGQSMTGEGDVSYAEGKQAMQMSMVAATGTIEMRLVDGVMYMSVPPMTPKGKFMRLDPAEGGPLGDLGGLSQGDPLAAFADFEAGLKDVTYVGPESVDGVDADHYVLTVDAQAAAKAQGGPTQGVPDEVTYDLWLDGDDLMRRLQFALPQGSFTMTMSDWGEPVTVEAPAKRDIITMPGAAG